MTVRARSQASEPTTLTPFESQGERRRRQLVDVAARLIEREGTDAVRIPRLAELAGVGRTAIYRYFQRREDVLDAVEQEFDHALRARIGDDEFVAGLVALADGASDPMPAATAHLFGAIWDLLDEQGPAGLILRGVAAVHEDVGDEARRDDRFNEPWLALGLSELQATLIGDTANALLARLYFRARAGEIDREAALHMGYRALTALVAGLRSE